MNKVDSKNKRDESTSLIKKTINTVLNLSTLWERNQQTQTFMTCFFPMKSMFITLFISNNYISIN